MNNSEFVSLKELAVEIGMDRSHARRFVVKNGVSFHKRRTRDSGGQPTLCLTVDQADIVRTMRSGFVTPIKLEASCGAGFFYVVRLVPELDPRRIKLGFADDVANRLAQHRTAAPTAAVVASWPCKRSWELTTIDCLARECRLILGEVYECDDLEGLLVKAGRFFELLPDPSSTPELSTHSPHNT